MPTLNWIGKESVINHDKEVPFRLLRKIKSKSVGEYSKNIIINGDNLEALKSLTPYYFNQIKCIYIDPPYNTGNDNWIYNDKVNSPKIKNWLGKVVGKESEDLCRHDKWLCMMYPRLKLLKELLSDNGVIFVSIDDNEYSNLKIIMDDIFSPSNHIETIVWKKRATPPNDRIIGKIHEYILCYKKTEKVQLYLQPRDEKTLARYSNPDNDPRGDWVASDLSANGKGGRLVKSCIFPIINPKNNEEYYPPKDKCWLYNKDKVVSLIEEKRIRFRIKSGAPFLKRYLSEVRQGITLPTILLDAGNSQSSALEQKELFDGENVFEFPKPVTLIKKLLTISTKSDDIILDSFAGSGTTGHAVLDLNKDDGGSRRFIMVELEDNVAEDITTERVKRAIKKYNYDDGFEYCELDRPLFDENGYIDKACSFEQLATYIYFTETKVNIDKSRIRNEFVGDYNGTYYYLLYNVIGKNVLEKSFLRKIKDNNRKVIYADKCLIDDYVLKENNIHFKQIPYDVKVY